MFNQVKREHIPNSSDKNCVFAGLNFFLLFHKFLRLLLNVFMQSEIMQKSSAVQNITNIIAVGHDKSGAV